jgi:hypothetical protein
MNEAATVALCDSNIEHWPGVQVTGSPADFSLLQEDAPDHWEYSLKLFSCSGVTPSGFVLASIPLYEGIMVQLTLSPQARRSEGNRGQGEAGEEKTLHGGWEASGMTETVYIGHSTATLEGRGSRETDHTCTYKTTPVPGGTVTSLLFILALSRHGETRWS